MKNNQPLVSIGLPVYNGQNFLSQAIESVLNQDYGKFELIISDNGSSDETAAICKSFLSKDQRIQYHRFDKNVGAAKNYNATYKYSKGKYFKWLAHDDTILPKNLVKCVEVLEAHDDVVICGGGKIHINANGEFIDSYDFSGLHILDENVTTRFKTFLDYFWDSFENADFVMGVMRSKALDKTNLIGSFPGSDFSLLAELVLKGKFHVISEPFFERRIHHGISMSVHNENPEVAGQIDPSTKIQYKSNAQVAKWFDPEGKAKRIPHFTWLRELVVGISKNKINGTDRFKLLLSSYHFFLYKFYKSLEKNIKLRLLHT